MILQNLIIVVMGLIFGSFVNAVSFRLNNLKSVFVGRSECLKCHHKLGFWDLAPVLSFLILKGKCRYCQQKISWQYPIVELATAILFVLIFLKLGFSVEAVYLSFTAVALEIIFISDIKKMIIPDEILWFLLGITIIWLFFKIFENQSLKILTSGFEGILIGGGLLAILYFVSKGKWMGFGDVKLAAILGLILGFPATILMIILSFLFGGFFGLILIALGKKHLKDKVAFGPFLAFSFIITILAGDLILNWYLNII